MVPNRVTAQENSRARIVGIRSHNHATIAEIEHQKTAFMKKTRVTVRKAVRVISHIEAKSDEEACRARRKARTAAPATVICEIPCVKNIFSHRGKTRGRAHLEESEISTEDRRLCRRQARIFHRGGECGWMQLMEVDADSSARGAARVCGVPPSDRSASNAQQKHPANNNRWVDVRKCQRGIRVCWREVGREKADKSRESAPVVKAAMRANMVCTAVENRRQ